MMDELKILRGNAFTVVIAVKAYRADGSEVEDFDLGSCSGVSVKMGVNALKSVDYVVTDNNITIGFSGSEGLGLYQLEVTGTLNDEKWRFDNERMLQIVEHSSGVNIPEDSILAEDSYTIQGNVQLLQAASSGEGVQSDWEEANTSSLAYIRNKPTIPTALSQLSQDSTHRVVTDTEKATWNGKSDFSGSYDDLTNKPAIPAAQVQSNWTEADTTSKAYIQNKPTIPDAQIQSDWDQADTTAKDYIKNKPSIPDAQVNSDWNAVSGVAEILNKPTLFSGDYADLTNKPNFATVATSGSYNDLSNTPTIPTVPTNVSAFTNDAGYLTSHQDISGKEDKVDIVSASGTTLTAEVGKYYTLSNVGTLAITLPTIAAGTTKVQTVTFYIAAGSTPAVTFTSTHSIYYSDGFEIAASSTYEVSAAYNGIAWVVASVKIVIPT